MPKTPTKIGILQALPDDGQTEAALKFLVLHQNSLQESLEFSFLPLPRESALLERLRASEYSAPLDADAVTREMPQFYAEYIQWVTEHAAKYGVPFDEPHSLIILSRARFSNRYYFIGEDQWSVIALGYWDAIMAPPSVVESILTLLIEIGVITACGENWPRSHYETKGCLFDFTASLKEARYKALTGFICASCEAAIEAAHSMQLVKDARTLAERNWLGDPEEPSHVSAMARKLGFPLFRTRGFSPTFSERARSIIEEEGTKVIFEIISALVIAALLLWLGLKD